MTRHFALAFVALGALLVPPSATAASPAQGDLRQDLDTAREEISNLTAEVAELTKLLDGVVAYVNTQAESAKAMSSTLSAADAEGFTAGINFKSREILLEGWRAQLEAASADLPGAPAAPAPSPRQ